MNIFVGSFAGPIVRHGMGAAGAWLVAQGVAEPGQLQEVSGALMTLGALGLSFLEKKIRF